ncbi:MAG: hypothetical protein PHD37_14155 [Gallionellaceae bacterium]|nr:hypothetical protein [Gallionellaceae bacterium]
MHDFLIELGLSKYDIALMVLCPLGAMHGSFAHTCLLTINPHRMPRPGNVRILGTIDALGRFQWIILRLTLGAILGIVIALYFIGSLQPNLTTLAKIIALSILLGFAAPKLWLAQERVVTDRALSMLQQMLSQRAGGEANESMPNTAVERDAPQAARPSP